MYYENVKKEYNNWKVFIPLFSNYYHKLSLDESSEKCLNPKDEDCSNNYAYKLQVVVP